MTSFLDFYVSREIKSHNFHIKNCNFNKMKLKLAVKMWLFNFLNLINSHNFTIHEMLRAKIKNSNQIN